MSSSETIDNNTQIEGMNGCPQNSTGTPHFMTGLHVPQNKLLLAIEYSVVRLRADGMRKTIVTHEGWL